jgi:predicted DCC family thiol-disulfide oxidoreductase YuxK
MTHPILLYDGVCGMCSRGVQFILKRDPAGFFRFAALQSRLAEKILARHGANPQDLNTMYVAVNAERADELLLARTDAVLFVLAHLGAPESRPAGQASALASSQAGSKAGRGLWRLGGLLLQLVPRKIRDWGYGVVVRNRYRMFGRYETCPVPSPEMRERFLDS